jgi:poly(A) polymerase
MSQTQRPPAAWMSEPAVQQVMNALTEDGGSARFVGGAVRDWLVGRPVSDIDIATTLAPDAVTLRLQAHDIRAIPTGLAHGTVTAVCGGKPFEITTLRRDVETDGRHATIAYTDDWAADAARRDFTMNALYAEPDGSIFDPTGGLADLDAGRVRFVGDAATRIREDYLRLLRFFRFHAHYGIGAPDRAGLVAAQALAPNLARLSAERVWIEMKKLLAAADPAPTVRVMAQHGILAPALTENCDSERLRHLVEFEPSYPSQAPRDPLRRLAALLPRDLDIAAFAERWRLSREESDRLAAIRHAADHAVPALARPWPLLRRHGAETVADGALVAAARGDHAALTLLPVAAFWTNPEFPVRGADLLALGYEPGPALGEALAEIEHWWEEGGCIADRAACLAYLASLPGFDDKSG